jgi:hypothetical protein
VGSTLIAGAFIDRYFLDSTFAAFTSFKKPSECFIVSSCPIASACRFDLKFWPDHLRSVFSDKLKLIGHQNNRLFGRRVANDYNARLSMKSLNLPLK